MQTGISDTAMMQLLGVTLLDTQDLTQQPIAWFSSPTTTSIQLPVRLTPQYRFLDITALAQAAGWQIQTQGSVLNISAPAAMVLDIQQGRADRGNSLQSKVSLEKSPISGIPRRLVVYLDRPTPWQVTQRKQTVTVTLAAQLSSTFLQVIAPNATPSPAVIATPATPNSTPAPAATSTPTAPNPTPAPTATPDPPQPMQIKPEANRTVIQVTVPPQGRPRVWALPNPNRLIIDLQSDQTLSRDLLWAPGLRWRQQLLSVGRDRFPVVWLVIDPCQPGLKLRPIWSNPTSLVGITPLLDTAQRWQVAAAINGGFFNRNRQMPLGAIRQEGQWLSSPILNRGAIAWDERGSVAMGRLSFQETLVTTTGTRLPLQSLNSGYVQAGIARYTPLWGTTYTPLTNDEVIMTIQGDRVINQQAAAKAGETAILIPTNGYLLVLRSNQTAASALPINTSLRLDTQTTPLEFSRYPYILSAGPLLLQNRQIVLDAKAEKFSDAFIRETAVRSAIARTADGKLLVVTVHDRLQGTGPTLAELASVVQQLGAVDALNLDGGSSTSLYLGGQIIDRSAQSVARVHNGIGIFIQAGTESKAP
jgi:hypothetical protein